MSNISYTAEVISVDEATKTMRVVYQREGYLPIEIGVRWPAGDETEADLIESAAPIYHWEAQDAPPAKAPAVGRIVTVTLPQDPPPLVLTKGDKVREARNKLLELSDWTQLADAPISQEMKLLWAEYRQALREIPQQAGFPDNVAWPARPDFENR